MVCYILDGYNIINQIDEFLNTPLVYQRELLIKFLVQRKPQGSYKNKVVIIFDGNPEVGVCKYENLRSYNIEVIFTSYQTADDKIKQIVKNLKDPKNFVVVTNDKEIRYYVRYYGVKVLSVEEFIKIKSTKVKQKHFSEEKSQISSEDIQKINNEIKQKFNI